MKRAFKRLTNRAPYFIAVAKVGLKQVARTMVRDGDPGWEAAAEWLRRKGCRVGVDSVKAG